MRQLLQSNEQCCNISEASSASLTFLNLISQRQFIATTILEVCPARALSLRIVEEDEEVLLHRQIFLGRRSDFFLPNETCHLQISIPLIWTRYTRFWYKRRGATCKWKVSQKQEFGLSPWHHAGMAMQKRGKAKCFFCLFLLVCCLRSFEFGPDG